MSRGGINWELVDEELGRVPAELQSDTFDSLPHVIDILSQVEPEVRLEEVPASLLSYLRSPYRHLPARQVVGEAVGELLMTVVCAAWAVEVAASECGVAS
jgi:hypothetical protein